MRGRQRPGLRPPRPGDGALVPTTGRRRPLWRACAAHHDQPWFHSSRDVSAHPGRFDLLFPRGTCYWALSPAGAVIEATADPDQDDPPVLTTAALSALMLWRAEHVSTARSKLADTLRAAMPHLTSEVASIVPYTLPWAWADELVSQGHNGVLYEGRFSHDESVALFGPSGAPGEPPSADPRPASAVAGQLPAAFRAGVGPVGTLAQLPRAPSP